MTRFLRDLPHQMGYWVLGTLLILALGALYATLRDEDTEKVPSGPPAVAIEGTVRQRGESGWSDVNRAAEGDELEYRIRVSNDGPTPATRLRVYAAMPPTRLMRYALGSCKMQRAKEPFESCSDEIVHGGMVFASIAPRGVLYVWFFAHVLGTDGFTSATASMNVNANETPETHDDVVTLFDAR